MGDKGVMEEWILDPPFVEVMHQQGIATSL